MRRGHGPCPVGRGGACLIRLSAAPARAGRPAPIGARSLRDVPRRRRGNARRAGLATVCRARVPRFPDVRLSRGRFRAISLRHLSQRSVGALLVQRARLLSELWRPSHDGPGGASGRSCLSACAGAAVGVESAAAAAICACVRSRAVPGRGSGLRVRRRTRGAMRRPCWRVSPQRRCVACGRLGHAPGARCADGGTRSTSRIRRRLVDGMPGAMDSTCTRVFWFPLEPATAWSGCAGTRCAHRSGRIVFKSCRRARSSSNCVAAGPMAQRISSSSRRSCSNAWPR